MRKFCENFLILLDRRRVFARASFVIKVYYNPCMRDFFRCFCSDFLFFAEKIHFFRVFFCWNQIKTKVFCKKIPQWRIFFIKLYRPPVGIWIDVLMY